MREPELKARSSDSDPRGKCDSRVETMVPESVKDDMLVFWRVAGFLSEAEYVRKLIYADLYGRFSEVQSVAQRAVGLNPGNTRRTAGDGTTG